MSVEPEAVITLETRPDVALSFAVNFGVFAGRDVSSMELERLARVLLRLVERVSITAEDRHEFSKQSAVRLHQVRIEIDQAALPETDSKALRKRIETELADWLQACTSGFSGQELTDAEIDARDAVVEGVFGESPSS